MASLRFVSHDSKDLAPQERLYNANSALKVDTIHICHFTRLQEEIMFACLSVRQHSTPFSFIKYMPDYAIVCQSMQKYARVCQSMPEYARVCKSFAKFCLHIAL